MKLSQSLLEFYRGKEPYLALTDQFSTSLLFPASIPPHFVASLLHVSLTWEWQTWCSLKRYPLSFPIPSLFTFRDHSVLIVDKSNTGLARLIVLHFIILQRYCILKMEDKTLHQQRLQLALSLYLLY